MNEYELDSSQEYWASKRKQGVPPSQLKQMLIKQKGLCALSGAPLLFDLGERTPETRGLGCHSLCPAVDHIDPSNPNSDVQIICHRLNDLKGFMPLDCFNALRATEPWKTLMYKWKEQAEKNPKDRNAFVRLLPAKTKPLTQKQRSAGTRVLLLSQTGEVRLGS
jgi:hypothetical protein